MAKRKYTKRIIPPEAVRTGLENMLAEQQQHRERRPKSALAAIATQAKYTAGHGTEGTVTLTVTEFASLIAAVCAEVRIAAVCAAEVRR